MRVPTAAAAAVVATLGCEAAVFAPQEPTELPPELTGPPVPGPGLGRTHVAPRGTGLPDTRPPAVEPSRPARALAATVATLREDTHPEHPGVVRALAELADAVAILAPDATVDHAQIRGASEQLASSDPSSLTHADAARSGLESAVRALATVEPFHPARSVRYQDALAQLGHAVERISPGVPLLEQLDRVVAAFEAATRTVFVAYGVDDPFESDAVARGRR